MQLSINLRADSINLVNSNKNRYLSDVPRDVAIKVAPDQRRLAVVHFLLGALLVERQRGAASDTDDGLKDVIPGDGDRDLQPAQHPGPAVRRD